MVDTEEQPRVISIEEIGTLLLSTALAYFCVLLLAYLYDTWSRGNGRKPVSYTPGLAIERQPIKVRTLLFLGSNKSLAGTVLLVSEIALGLGELRSSRRSCCRQFILACCAAAVTVFIYRTYVPERSPTATAIDAFANSFFALRFLLFLYLSAVRFPRLRYGE